MMLSMDSTVEVIFGRYIKKSRICPICTRKDHMEINALRGQQHLSYEDISIEKKTTLEALEVHFKKHFLISTKDQQLLNLKENDSQEANELVSRILDGNADLYSALHDLLKAKAQRYHMIQEQIKTLSDQQEIDNLTDIEKQEFIFLSRLSDGMEDKILKVYQLIEKKLFPDPETTAKAILNYKLDIFSKLVDSIITVFIEVEKQPQYTQLIQQIRVMLAQQVSVVEADILKSGGIIRTVEATAIEDQSDQDKETNE